MKIMFFTSSPTGSLDDSYIVEGLDPANGFVDALQYYWDYGHMRCLMIAAYPEEHDINVEMTEFFAEAFEEAELYYEDFDLWDWENEDFSEENLNSYNCIILSGGHVPTENAFFQEIGLREKLENWSGIIIGISAGTMNSADLVYSSPEEPGEAIDPDYQRFLPGLGLTETMILPHYQMVKDNILDGMRLFEDIIFPDSYGHEFLALPDGSFLFSNDGEEEIHGEAYIIADGTITQIQ